MRFHPLLVLCLVCTGLLSMFCTWVWLDAVAYREFAAIKAPNGDVIRIWREKDPLDLDQLLPALYYEVRSSKGEVRVSTFYITNVKRDQDFDFRHVIANDGKLFLVYDALEAAAPERPGHFVYILYDLELRATEDRPQGGWSDYTPESREAWLPKIKQVQDEYPDLPW